VDNVIEVCCIATPDGRASWCRADAETIAQFWTNWRASLPAEKRDLFEKRGCTGGVVTIRMLESAYCGITASADSATLFPECAR
jgi:hypothetical protein